MDRVVHRRSPHSALDNVVSSVIVRSAMERHAQGRQQKTGICCTGKDSDGSTASKYGMTSATTAYGGDYVDVLHRSDKQDIR